MVGFVLCGAKLFVRLSLLLAVFRLKAELLVAATCSIRFGRLKKRKCCDVMRRVLLASDVWVGVYMCRYRVWRKIGKATSHSNGKWHFQMEPTPSSGTAAAFYLVAPSCRTDIHKPYRIRAYSVSLSALCSLLSQSVSIV